MENPHYALVAYLQHPVGDFVENLRRELHPALPHLPAHVTILPPRQLVSDGNRIATEAAALDALGEMCRTIDPFEIGLGEVETFVPITPTVFIRIEEAGERLQDLHDRLNTGMLLCEEQWPYIPHLTIVKMAAAEQALGAYDIARERWQEYHGSHRIPVEQLTFVREGDGNRWVDLAPVRLGRSLVQGSGR
jgi:2'-5' RNA ligase